MSAGHRNLPPDAPAIVRTLAGGCSRVLLLGAMGSGKSTLAAALAEHWPGPAWCLSADPGSPAFGVPGAASLGEWQRPGGWRCFGSEPLCTLDAARFRLPLVRAAARLARRVPAHDPAGLLVVDAPGVARGVAAAELLQGLAEAAEVDAVMVLDAHDLPHLRNELAASGLTLFHVPAHPAARRPPSHEREARRTSLWNDHLSSAIRQSFPLDALQVTGTPPPRSVPEAWCGRQAALLHGPEALQMGEVVELVDETLTLALPAPASGADTLLLRDAWRTGTGVLVTAPRAPAGSSGRPVPASARGMREGQTALEVSVPGVRVSLANGVFGDPLVELRLANRHRRLLFDLGEAMAVPVKTLHAVGDVFVSHGHFDHIGGFPALLRARLSGDPPPCRLYGPAGMAEHVSGFVKGVRWDRIGDTGPRFLVAEVAGERLRWWRIQPGCEPEELAPEPLEDRVLLRGQGFSVHFTVLDHGIPVLAFLLELDDKLHVREDALARRGLRPGPWLGELKHRLGCGQPEAIITLPDGSRAPAGVLAESLVTVTPGSRIAYATDLADTPDNRRRLGRLAAGADLFICEATFLEADAGQAATTRHLTVAACAEIALAAGVGRLLPFHFSRRYAKRLPEVHQQLREVVSGTALEGKLVGVPALVRP